MRTKFFIGLIIWGLSTSALIGQKSKDPVLLTIAGDEVKLSEFEAIYNKNNNNKAIDPKSVEEYLELYINFKLKVKEAEEMGLDTSAKFIKELAGYRDQLAKPYLSDKEVTEKLIDEVYDRLQKEVRASHILLTVSPQATPEDTLEAYNQILDLRKRAMNGESFEELALQYSKDPSVAENKGDLGYFSALYMVYPFETGAYNTPVGEVSEPIRTRYGYHIIKVTDKRPYQGEITAAHIMVKLNQNPTEEEVAKAKKKIDEIYAKVKSGEDFGELAKSFSDDKGSSKRGGVLAPFKSGKMIMEFENAAFALENDGDISEPVQTKYGWHIIKRVNKTNLPPLEDIRLDLKEKISKDSRSNKSRTSMLKKIRDNYGYKEKLEERNDFYEVVDSSFFKGEWQIENANGLNKVMIELGDEKYTQQDFAKYIYEKQRAGNYIDPKIVVNALYEDFSQEVCFNYENKRLEEKYPEFNLLVQEYHDGILLFDLTDKKVWSKAVTDTTGLKNFYERNKDNYRWDERLHAVVYSCSDMDVAKRANELAEKHAQGSISLDSIKKTINTNSQLNITIEEGKFSKGDNEVIDKIKWTEGITKIQKQGDRFVFVEVVEKLDPTFKELNEVRGLVTSDYQNYLEKEWIKELRSKYKVQVNKDVLKGIK